MSTRPTRTVEPYLSPDDIAGRLGMSIRWVRERIARGDFARAVRLGAAVRVPESSVAAWLSRQPAAVRVGCVNA